MSKQAFEDLKTVQKLRQEYNEMHEWYERLQEAWQSIEIGKLDAAKVHLTIILDDLDSKLRLLNATIQKV